MDQENAWTIFAFIQIGNSDESLHGRTGGFVGRGTCLSGGQWESSAPRSQQAKQQGMLDQTIRIHVRMLPYLKTGIQQEIGESRTHWAHLAAHRLR
jgi:hypothetical protein